MQIHQTGIEGLLEIMPTVYHDNRGWFFEFYKCEYFKSRGIPYSFLQENISYSKKGVIRGLHFQLPPFDQAKLVCVLGGKVLDVVADLRSNSATFGKTHTCMLDSDKHNMLLVPEGFAHGFAALEDTLFIYKSSNIYNPESECGVRWNDPTLLIHWPFDDPIMSDKDRQLPTIEELLRKSVISRA